MNRRVLRCIKCVLLLLDGEEALCEDCSRLIDEAQEAILVDVGTAG